MTNEVRIEWNEEKARSNLEKHGISFEEAQTVFLEDDALLYDDPDHSNDEQRFLLIGPSASLRLLVVVHCFREPDEVIRIISARQATRREARTFVTQRST